MAQETAQAMMVMDQKTGPATDRPRNVSSRLHDAGRAVNHGPSIFMLTLLLLFAAHPALAEEENTVLARCGISYPMGYDANTVGDVPGQVLAITLPGSGPVSFQLKAGRDSYTVLASPVWHWRDNAADITAGAEVIVHGSKSLGKDNNLYIIAQEIKIAKTGKILNFRTAEGAPLWSRQRGMRAGRQGGTGSGMHGGPGGGGGGLMRGRSR